MSLLNQDIAFSQLDYSVQNAFPGRISNKVRLNSGTSLFRFSRHTGISPWWSETSGLANLLLRAKTSGKSLHQFIRDSTAILRRWDPHLTNLIIATLNQSVYAFQGKIASQNEASIYIDRHDIDNYRKKFTKPVFFNGGNNQLYINGISSGYVNIVVPGGAVTIYDDIDDILDFLISYGLI